MPYRRPPQNTKKFLSPYSGIKQGNFSNTANAGHYKDYISIPMPNEKETTDYFGNDRKKALGFPAILNFFREHVKIEELILVGLIFLVLDESIEDDFLLIILVYILIF